MNKKISSLLPLFFLFSFWGFSQTVFINEINHFDAGSKGVEIAGPAGTDIGGWSLVFYDLNGAVITTQPIASMIIPDLQNTYGLIWIDVILGLQSNDGAVGLVDNMGQPVQFISYGGTITAVGGLFFGLTSENAGQQTVAGETLQLTGTGNIYPDFTWDSPGTFTMGAVNTNQMFENVQGSAALPVELLFFTGKMTDGNAQLTWATANESDNDYFRVEHSRNGKDFTEIAEISGAGYSTETVQYHFTHTEVARGINYYRLVQTDFNGSTNISDVINIIAETTDEPIINVYPNPTSDRLTIQMPDVSDNRIQVRLFDNMGRIVRQAVFTTNDRLELEVADLPQGTYSLHLNNSKITHNQLVIVK